MRALEYKKCTDCNCCFLTYANTPYCRHCIRNYCALAHHPCDDGRHECNCTFDMITYQGEHYCLGHFKTLQNYCASCDTIRPENCKDFQHDHMWYCPLCRYDFKRETVSTVMNALQNFVYNDIVVEILKKVVTPATHRYPDSFNIPLQRKLT